MYSAPDEATIAASHAKCTELRLLCLQGPPFNAAIKDTNAVRGTYYSATLAFALLTLDVIPGLTELVSLVRMLPNCP